MAAVSLPKGYAASGTGFSFELPESVRSIVTESSPAVGATLTDGAALPNWLSFNSAELKFEARAVPDGAFPMQLLVTIGAQRVLVVISERSE
jgi:hypothetical protein